MAKHAPATSTRRNLLSGAAAAGAALLAAPAALAASSDADLLAACAEYHRAHATWNGPYVSDEMTDHLGSIRQAALVAVMEKSHRTPAGLRAKASVALSAGMFDADTFVNVHWRDHARAEQILAIDVLTSFLAEG